MKGGEVLAFFFSLGFFFWPALLGFHVCLTSLLMGIVWDSQLVSCRGNSGQQIGIKDWCNLLVLGPREILKRKKKKGVKTLVK